MLGIPEMIAGAVARQKTAHSWLRPLLMLKGEKFEEKEAALEAWMQSAVEQMYPELERAGRMVREVAGLLLEREAMKEWGEKNRQVAVNVPCPRSAGEAAHVAGQEVMYPSPEELEATERVLELLESGMLVPPARLLEA